MVRRTSLGSTIWRYLADASRALGCPPRGARPNTTDAKDPEVVVVRSPWPSVLFGWEIRGAGGIVLKRSTHGYSSAALARGAGEGALESDPRLQGLDPPRPMMEAVARARLGPVRLSSKRSLNSSL